MLAAEARPGRRHLHAVAEKSEDDVLDEAVRLGAASDALYDAGRRPAVLPEAGAPIKAAASVSNQRMSILMSSVSSFSLFISA